jgi:mannose-6-phosphate isomerase-like protein (cupin superfamily)
VSAVVWMPGGIRTRIVQTGEDTDGAFCLLVDEPPPGWSLPPHRHLREAETILVLEGAFCLDVGGERIELGPGESVVVPAGTTHSGGALGDGGGRRVVIFSPAGLERFFLEVGTAAPDDPVDVRAALESAARFGWEF